MLERQSGFLIKTLTSDRGGEYNSKEFDKFCNDLGLERQLTTAYTPQQNGVAFRKTGLLSKWQSPCYMRKNYLMFSGEKQSILLCIC